VRRAGQARRPARLIRRAALPWAGNRRQQAFFEAGGYALYRDLLAAQCAAHGVAVWRRVLMPDHVHLIATP
jgi:REP element-mobilizing transposase RayT